MKEREKWRFIFRKVKMMIGGEASGISMRFI